MNPEATLQHIHCHTNFDPTPPSSLRTLQSPAHGSPAGPRPVSALQPAHHGRPDSSSSRFPPRCLPPRSVPLSINCQCLVVHIQCCTYALEPRSPRCCYCAPASRFLRTACFVLQFRVFAAARLRPTAPRMGPRRSRSDVAPALTTRSESTRGMTWADCCAATARARPRIRTMRTARTTAGSAVPGSMACWATYTTSSPTPRASTVHTRTRQEVQISTAAVASAGCAVFCC